MTLVESYRLTTWHESLALRAWARAGMPPAGKPMDRWTEWLRHQHTNTSSRVSVSRATPQRTQ